MGQAGRTNWEVESQRGLPLLNMLRWEELCKCTRGRMRLRHRYAPNVLSLLHTLCSHRLLAMYETLGDHVSTGLT